MRRWAALAVLAVGCGDDGGDLVDASRDVVVLDAGGAPITPPAAPAAPALPAFEPCPPGWRLADLACEPWPEGGRRSCPDGETHFPGEPGCTRIGSACPAGDFPEGLPAGTPVVYVRAGATGGDGTMAAPFGRIAEAAAGAATGTIIAVARGTYEELVTVPPGVTLWGACVTGTTLTSSTASDLVGVVTSGGASSIVRNLTIADARCAGAVVARGRRLRLQDVVVRSVETTGLLVRAGGELEVRSVVVTGTRPNATDDTSGVSLAVGDGTARIERTVFERSERLAVLVYGAEATARLEDVAVLDLRSTLAGRPGRGIEVGGGATLVLAGVVVERVEAIGLFASGEATTADLTHVVLRDVAGTPEEPRGRGLELGRGATVDGRSMLIGGGQVGVFVLSARATLEDLVIRDTEGVAGDVGRGVEVGSGGDVVLRRAIVERNADFAIDVVEPDAVLVLEDVTVRDTVLTGGTMSGLGVQVRGGRLSGARVLIERAHVGGLAVFRDTAAVTLEDLTIRDTRPTEPAPAGRAVNIQGGTVDLARVLIEDSSEVGVRVTETGAVLRLTDAIVRDTESNPDGGFGYGVEVRSGARGELLRVQIERSRGVGLFVAEDASASLMDVAIDDTLPEDCAAPPCNGGHGLATAYRTALEAARVHVGRSALCGLFLIRDASLMLADGEIVSNAIGACVPPDFDTASLAASTRFRDNDLDFDVRDMPVPEPVPDL